MAEVRHWRATGDWFDVCKCTIPCPCTFAQAPSEGDCDGIMAWHIREGRFGDVRLDGLNVVALSYFKGNVWAGETKATVGIYMDERADEHQREALQMIFGGEAGGWPAEFASVIGEVRGIEYVPITFELADDLAYWAAEVPGRATHAPKRWRARRRPTVSVCRSTTLPARKSVLARLRPGAKPPPPAPTASASSGNGTAARASTSHSTGRARRTSAL